VLLGGAIVGGETRLDGCVVAGPVRLDRDDTLVDMLVLPDQRVPLAPA
jgi:hypothetical protein